MAVMLPGGHDASVNVCEPPGPWLRGNARRRRRAKRGRRQTRGEASRPRSVPAAEARAEARVHGGTARNVRCDPRPGLQAPRCASAPSHRGIPAPARRRPRQGRRGDHRRCSRGGPCRQSGGRRAPPTGSGRRIESPGCAPRPPIRAQPLRGDPRRAARAGARVRDRTAGRRRVAPHGRTTTPANARVLANARSTQPARRRRGVRPPCR
mmetsp:Transcript_61168/g.144531  ORF Transcript_61168/g.144531 Transcript_61168/m.144531 type:complete len:209 (-) Transcript_61168:1751-2377(-)